MRIAALLLALSTGCTGGHVARLNLGRTPPGVAVDAQVHYYDVTAATLAELRRGMRELGPRWEGRSWQAATKSTFRWTFQYERAGVHSCELRKVRVQVRTVVTFPRWNPTAEPDSAMLAWWHQLNAGLLEHERGHAQLSVTTAGAIARELEGMSGGNCAALATRANAIGSRHIDASRRKQVDYDRTTRHGATQIELAGRLSSP